LNHFLRSGEEAGNSFPVVVPCCFETLPAFSSYRGEGAFERDFEAEGDISLVFKGVSHTGRIYVDDKYIGEHYNAYTPFSFVINNLDAGKHHLKVVADNRFSEKSALHVPNDYMTYGGINRGVVLEFLPEAYITRLHAVPELTEKGWNLSIDIDVVGKPSSVYNLSTELCDIVNANERVIIGENGSTLVHFNLNAENVEEWSPENPKLYPIKAVLKDDMGNAVRMTHYPNDELFLDLCDEEGVLVWEENHARGLSEEQMRNPNFEPQEEKVTEEMVDYHINHPCILFWGILNECASDSEYGKSCYAAQYAILRKMDKSRPVSSASCKFFTDICLDLPDIVSYNLYPEWYVQDKTAKEWVEENYNWVQEKTKGAGKPFLITEIGAGAIYGYRSQTHDNWTEEYQAEVLDHQLNAVFSTEGISGVFIWQYCDVRISREWFNIRPRTMNNKGIVDEYRRRKLAYDVVKKIYRSYGNYFE